MTERSIQRILHREIRTATMALPNCNALGHEADFLVLSRAGLVTEYEIKVTIADLRADAKKSKHQSFNRWIELEKRTKHNPMIGYLEEGKQPPNYFYYVFPPELEERLNVEPIDMRYGIMIIGRSRVFTRRKAKRLHGTKITELARNRMEASANGRFWNLRNMIDDNPVYSDARKLIEKEERDWLTYKAEKKPEPLTQARLIRIQQEKQS